MARTMPGGRVEIIAQAGHLTAVEQPEAFNTAVARFLSAELGAV